MIPQVTKITRRIEYLLIVVLTIQFITLPIIHTTRESSAQAYIIKHR